MLNLFEQLPNSVELNGKKINVNYAFDLFLLADEIMQDEDFSEIEKTEIICSNFIGENKLSFAEKQEVISLIYDSIKEKSINSNNKPVICFKQDAKYIYASFKQCYNIDLFEQQGKLHFMKFNALLASLTDDTMLKKIIDIRMKKIPALTPHNKDYVENLQRQKVIYALRNNKESSQDVMKNVANSLINIANSNVKVR